VDSEKGIRSGVMEEIVYQGKGGKFEAGGRKDGKIVFDLVWGKMMDF